MALLTIDNYCLSMVVDLKLQIRLSVTLDERRRPVFRSFRQISARIGGIAAVIRAAVRSLLLTSEVGLPRDLLLWQPFLPPPLLRTPNFQPFPPRMANRARLTRAIARRSFVVAFRVWRGCIQTIKHACNWSFSHALLICTKHLKIARENHGKTASRQSAVST